MERNLVPARGVQFALWPGGPDADGRPTGLQLDHPARDAEDCNNADQRPGQPVAWRQPVGISILPFAKHRVSRRRLLCVAESPLRVANAQQSHEKAPQRVIARGQSKVSEQRGEMLVGGHYT